MIRKLFFMRFNCKAFRDRLKLIIFMLISLQYGIYGQFKVSRFVIANGGSTTLDSLGSGRIFGTIGQGIVGLTFPPVSGIHHMCHGFWCVEYSSFFVNIKEVESNQILYKAYPNPTKDLLNIELKIKNPLKLKIKLINEMGAIIKNLTITC